GFHCDIETDVQPACESLVSASSRRPDCAPAEIVPGCASQGVVATVMPSRAGIGCFDFTSFSIGTPAGTVPWWRPAFSASPNIGEPLSWNERYDSDVRWRTDGQTCWRYCR